MTCAGDCGDLQEQLQKMSDRFKGLLVDFENLQTDLVAKNRVIGQLKAQIAKLESDEDQVNQQTRAQADAVFAYWKACCWPKARAFGDEREKAVYARLRAGWTVDDIFTAIDGAADDPFVDGKGKKHDDLELICRNETKFRSFYQRGEKYRQDQQDRLDQALAIDTRDPERVAYLTRLAAEAMSNVVQLPTRRGDPTEKAA